MINSPEQRGEFYVLKTTKNGFEPNLQFYIENFKKLSQRKNVYTNEVIRVVLRKLAEKTVKLRLVLSKDVLYSENVAYTKLVLF